MRGRTRANASWPALGLLRPGYWVVPLSPGPALAAGRAGASGPALLPDGCCFFPLPFEDPLRAHQSVERSTGQARGGVDPAAGVRHHALAPRMGLHRWWAPRQPVERAPLPGSQPDPVVPGDAPEGFGPALLVRVCPCGAAGCEKWVGVSWLGVGRRVVRVLLPLLMVFLQLLTQPARFRCGSEARTDDQKVRQLASIRAVESFTKARTILARITPPTLHLLTDDSPLWRSARRHAAAGPRWWFHSELEAAPRWPSSLAVATGIRSAARKILLQPLS